jgi:hypothetical protein
VKLISVPAGALVVNMDDDIVAACLMCRDGQAVKAEALKVEVPKAADAAPKA